MVDDHKGDMRDLRDTLQRELREGFDGVHSRLDTLNGRVGKGEVTLGQHDVKLANLEREVFRRRRNDGSVAAARDEEGKSRPLVGRAVSERDVRIVWMTLAAIVGAIEIGMRIGPAIVRMWPR